MSREYDKDIAKYLFGIDEFQEINGEIYGTHPKGGIGAIPYYTSKLSDAELILDKVDRYRIDKKGGNLITVTLWINEGSAYAGRGFNLMQAMTSSVMMWINRKIKDNRDHTHTHTHEDH